MNKNIVNEIGINKISIKKAYYISYLMCFALFSLQILPSDVLLFAAIAIFIFSPMDTTPYLFIISLPWSEVGKFSFGITLSLIQTSIYILKIVLVKKKLTMRVIDIVTVVYLMLIGIVNLLVYSSLNGISMVLYFIIATQLFYTYIMRFADKDDTWKLLLLSLLISVVFATIYGLRTGTSLERWVSGSGYVMQLYGTLGTTRFGMYICICLVFELFYIKKPWLKVLLCTITTVGVLATLSMTALLIMVFIYIYYFCVVVNSVSVRQKVAIILGILIFLILFICYWPVIRGASFVQPVVNRLENIYSYSQQGDMDRVFTGRVSLGNEYMEKFFNSSLVNKIFGSASYALDSASNYSHNSFIDMLNYCGIIGCIIFGLLQICRIFQYKKTILFHPIFLVKLIVSIVGTTVSMFSAQFWLIWFYM